MSRGATRKKRISDLLRLAKAARLRAWAPYSRFRVGAALLARSGKVYTGANVENASYGLSLCAERVAFARAVSEGERKFSALAVVTGSREPATPCRACRQTLLEFGTDMRVYCANLKGDLLEDRASGLLPRRFGRGHLRKPR